MNLCQQGPHDLGLEFRAASWFPYGMLFWISHQHTCSGLTDSCPCSALCARCLADSRRSLKFWLTSRLPPISVCLGSNLDSRCAKTSGLFLANLTKYFRPPASARAPSIIAFSSIPRAPSSTSRSLGGEFPEQLFCFPRKTVKIAVEGDKDAF